MEAIDEGLDAISSASREIIHGILHSDNGITKETLPTRLPAFSEILTLAFGAGADSILQYIIERI
jgi:hypothetical protein